MVDRCPKNGGVHEVTIQQIPCYVKPETVDDLLRMQRVPVGERFKRWARVCVRCGKVLS